MKKSVIAVGVAIVLGLSYTGASWYTGNVIQQDFASNVKQINQEINKLNPNMKYDITYSDYQKGIFSTSIHLKVVGQFSNQPLFDDNVTIYHGPFPWSEIKSGHLAPKMASLFYQYVAQNNKEDSDQSVITINSAVNYSEIVTVNAKLSSLKELNYENILISSDNADITMTTDKTFNYMTMDGSIKSLNLQLVDSPTDITFNDIGLSMNKTLSDDSVSKIDQDMTIDKVTFSQPHDANKFIFNQWTLKGHGQEQNNNIDSSATSHIAHMTFGNQDMGSLNMQVDYDMTEGNNDEKILNLAINDVIWKTKHGDLNGNFDVILTGDSIHRFDVSEINQSNLQRFNAKLSIPFDTLAYMMAQFDEPNKTEPSEDDIMLKSQMLQMVSPILSSQLPGFFYVVTDNNSGQKAGVYLDVSYSKETNSATVNGKEMTDSEFWSLYGHNTVN